MTANNNNNNNNIVTMTSERQLWALRESILAKTNAGEFTLNIT